MPITCEQPKTATLPEAIEAFAQECLAREHPRSYLIPVLHKLQSTEGYLKQEHLERVAELFNTSVADITGVATFYHYFTLEPRGQNEIAICLGTACHVKGAGKILEKLEKRLGIKDGETTKDGQFSIKPARCVGMCALAPVVIINDKVYGNVTVEQVDEILNTYGYTGDTK